MWKCGIWGFLNFLILKCRFFVFFFSASIDAKCSRNFWTSRLTFTRHSGWRVCDHHNHEEKVGCNFYAYLPHLTNKRRCCYHRQREIVSTDRLAVHILIQQDGQVIGRRFEHPQSDVSLGCPTSYWSVRVRVIVGYWCTKLAPMKASKLSLL